MKWIIYSTAVFSCLFLSGCVHRVVTESPAFDDPAAGDSMEGLIPNKKVVDDRTIWIWQADFWN